MEDPLCTNPALADHFYENAGICTSALKAGLKPTVKTTIAGVVDQLFTWVEIVQDVLRVESNSAHFAGRVVAAQHTPSTGNRFKSKKNQIKRRGRYDNKYIRQQKATKPRHQCVTFGHWVRDCTVCLSPLYRIILG
jgi:hypothetical protein